MSKKEQEFNDWFDSLTVEEQKEYFADQQADYWINYYKSFPEEYDY